MSTLQKYHKSRWQVEVLDEFGKSLICTMFLKTPSFTFAATPASLGWDMENIFPPCWISPKEKYLKHLIRRCRNSWRDSHPNQFFTNFKPGIVFLVDLCPFPSSAFYLLVRNYPFVGIKFTQQLGLDGCHIQWPSTLDFPISIHSKTLWTTWMVIPMYHNVGTYIIYLYIHIYIYI